MPRRRRSHLATLSEATGVAPDGTPVIDGLLEDITRRKQALQLLVQTL